MQALLLLEPLTMEGLAAAAPLGHRMRRAWPLQTQEPPPARCSCC